MLDLCPLRIFFKHVPHIPSQSLFLEIQKDPSYHAGIQGLIAGPVVAIILTNFVLEIFASVWGGIHSGQRMPHSLGWGCPHSASGAGSSWGWSSLPSMEPSIKSSAQVHADEGLGQGEMMKAEPRIYFWMYPTSLPCIGADNSTGPRGDSLYPKAVSHPHS